MGINDRESLINVLECCCTLSHNGPKCANCEYADLFHNADCETYLLRDALALLKAQKPKVLTWQEVIGSVLECKPVYIEVRESEDKEPGDDRWAMMQQYKDNLTNGMLMAKSSYIISEVMFEKDYGKVWRCWDKEPTDEQRQNEPWKE